MKIFLSWSGDLSHQVAMVLRDWLPSVLQYVSPYVSSVDIDKGTRWSTDIAQELETSSFGILCVTSDNIEAPWLNFEAGALSKSIDKSKVCPFLFKIKRSEIKEGPTLQFQSTIFEKKDVKKLLASINNSCDTEKLENERLDKAFEVWWPNLEEELGQLNIPAKSKGNKTSKGSDSPQISNEILEEILELSRRQQRSISDLRHLPMEVERLIERRSENTANPKAIHDIEMGVNAISELLETIGESESTASIEKIRATIEGLNTPIQYLLDTHIRQKITFRRARHPKFRED